MDIRKIIDQVASGKLNPDVAEQKMQQQLNTLLMLQRQSCWTGYQLWKEKKGEELVSDAIMLAKQPTI